MEVGRIREGERQTDTQGGHSTCKAPEIPVVVVVGVRDGVTDEFARKTLRALLVQSHARWRAVVVVTGTEICSDLIRLLCHVNRSLLPCE